MSRRERFSGRARYIHRRHSANQSMRNGLLVVDVQQDFVERGSLGVVPNGRHEAAYSAFEAVDVRRHKLLDVLKENRIDHIDVCGIATDYCVRASALDARKNQFQVRVLVNLCAPVNEDTGQQALDEMKAAGCQVQAATAP